MPFVEAIQNSSLDLELIYYSNFVKAIVKDY